MTMAEAEDDCWFSGVYYTKPSMMPQTNATFEKDIKACQARCQLQMGCLHFTYWPDQSCYLTSSMSKLEAAGLGYSPVRSGPSDCDVLRHYHREFLSEPYLSNSPGTMANRGDLSAEIQWLLQLAGTADFIEAIFDYLRDPESKKKLHVNREAKTLRDGEGKNRLLFFGGDAGHWVYCPATNDKSAVQWNSYELGHQKSGSHQFCQSFAQIYMLADLVGDKEFGTENATTPRTLLNSLREKRNNDDFESFGANVKVVAKYWRAVMEEVKRLSTVLKWPEITPEQYLLNELKGIHDVDHGRTMKIRTCFEALSTAMSFHFLQVKLQAKTSVNRGVTTGQTACGTATGSQMMNGTGVDSLSTARH
eukprot:symbB.v1.2.006493.t1/scaffold361.1/size299464/16